MLINVNSLNIYYEKCGTGHPLIMLHSNGESHKIFDKTVDVLKKYFTVYTIDTRGHGSSDVVKELHYTDIAEDVYEFIKMLHLDKPILYGFSDGGIIGIILAIKYPELLSKVIASGVNISPDGIKLYWRNIFKLIYYLTKSDKFRLMLEEPNIPYDLLQKIKTPFHITAGSNDMIKKEHMKKITENIKDSTFKIFDKESHSSYIVHSDKIAYYILEMTDITD